MSGVADSCPTPSAHRHATLDRELVSPITPPDVVAQREALQRRLRRHFLRTLALRAVVALAAIANGIRLIAVESNPFGLAWIAGGLLAFFAIRHLRPDDDDEQPVRLSPELAAAIRERHDADGPAAAVALVRQTTAASTREAIRAVDVATGSADPIAPSRQT